MRAIGILFFLSFFFSSCKKTENSNLSDHINKKNVLLIFVDDLNDKLGCYGDTIVKSPNIDALATNSTTFKKSFCQYPLCNPSRASILTGIRPTKIGVTNLKTDLRDVLPDVVTLPQLFKENGYFTGRTGKVFHMGVPDAMARCSQGKDDPLAWTEIGNATGYELNSNGHYHNASPYELDTVGTGGSIAWLRAEKGDDFQYDYNVATSAIDQIKRNKEKPFFIAAGFVRPHVPLVAPRRFFELYDSIEISLPNMDKSDRDDVPLSAINTFSSNFHISDSERVEAHRAYYACISFIDEQIGRLLQTLKDEGLDKNTIVVFVSDHGFQLGEKGLWFKNYLYYQCAISPLIIKDPSIENQSLVYNEAVELLDIYPTLAELAGLQATNQQGKSLVPALNGQSLAQKHAIVETYRDKNLALATYTKEWSYMKWKDGEELYDLVNDPMQTINLAANQEFNSIKDSLNQLLNEVYP